jgi:uncharacterized protein
MIDKKLKTVIERNNLAFATIDKNNKPNVVYFSCVKVISKNQLLITDNYMNKTRKNILKNPTCALAVTDSKLDCGYQLKGKAKYFFSGKWLKQVKALKENKGHPAKGAVVVTIKEIIALA